MEMSHAESRLTFSRKSSFKKLKIEMFPVSRYIHDCNIRRLKTFRNLNAFYLSNVALPQDRVNPG